MAKKKYMKPLAEVVAMETKAQLLTLGSMGAYQDSDDMLGEDEIL